jgi:hypothetical protein
VLLSRAAVTGIITLTFTNVNDPLFFVADEEQHILLLL